MSNPESLGVPLAYLARLLRLGGRPARELAADGTFVRLARGRYDLEQSVGNYAERERAVAAGRGGEAAQLDLSRERARLAKEQADGIAMKNAIVRSEYLLGEEVAQRWETVLTGVRQRMLALPSKVQQRLTGLSRHDVEEIDRAVREALEDGADFIESLPAGSFPDE